LNAAEVEVHVVTNQRCVALGLVDEAGLDSIHRRLVELLAADGAMVDSIQVCPHDLDSCSCRKPSDGLLRQVLATSDRLDPTRCAVIGDSWSDVRAGDALGTFRILLRPGGGAAGIADLVVPDLPTAVHHLLAASTPARNPGSGRNMR
jgi:D-glycero-D-manno-heptose 1,7-bisphosphate phosphatase